MIPTDDANCLWLIFGSMNKKPQNQPKSNKFIFLSGSGVPRLFGTCGLFRFFVELRRVEMTVDMEGV